MDPRTARRRLTFLLLGTAAWYAIIIVRLATVQLVEGTTLQGLAARQQSSTIEITAPRGAIRDREGRPLALSREVHSIYAVPSAIEDPRRTADLLAKTLKLGRRTLRKRLADRSRDFVWVARKVSDRQAERVEKLGLEGVESLRETRRFYPHGVLAAHVLGYVGMDNVGFAGIEHQYDKDISGTPGRQVTLRDARGQRFLPEPRGTAPRQGHSAVLTLDAVVQYHAEQALEAAVRESRAKRGVVVGLDPRSGEILALASWPVYDPNDYGRYSPESWRNGAMNVVFEPGSTFKMVTVATALEAGRVRLDEVIDCERGGVRVNRHRFADHKPFDMLTPREIITYSSNVGAIKIGIRLPETTHHQSLRRFGFGQPTGVDLPGEERGILHPPRNWSGLSQASMSMGQEVGVTALQMAAAFAAVANDGTLMQPYLLKRLVSATGDVVLEREPTPVRRVASPATASTLVGMLEQVVATGTGKAAQLDGYTAAGKTGTAQKPGPGGAGYLPGRYVASFVGFAPSRRPRLVLFVALDEPKGRYHGGEVAAPVFRSIAQPALAYLGTPPDEDGRRVVRVLRDHFPRPESPQALPDRGVALAARRWLRAAEDEAP